MLLALLSVVSHGDDEAIMLLESEMGVVNMDSLYLLAPGFVTPEDASRPHRYTRFY